MADVLAVRNEFRLQNWMEIIRECEESGLSNREFCFQRGISEKTYYYWLRKVRAAAATVIEPQLVRVDNPTMSGTEQLIEIRYGKTELRLPEDVDLKALAAFLKALRRHD
jgi:transposase